MSGQNAGATARAAVEHPVKKGSGAMGSVHMKLVMIMVLLIVCLMTVVGAFLINSVSAFYLEDFYSQIAQVFLDEELCRDLTTKVDGEEDGAAKLGEILKAYAGELGVDGRNRKLYILDSNGQCRVRPAGDTAPLQYTSNLTFALTTGLETGESGDESNLAVDYMDVAIPIHRGDDGYVIYILDNKTTANDLTDQMFLLIMEALVFGLVITVLLTFPLSSTMVTPIRRLTEGSMRVGGTSPIRSRWPLRTRSACSPIRSTTWPDSCRTPCARWRTSATSWTPCSST